MKKLLTIALCLAGLVSQAQTKRAVLFGSGFTPSSGGGGGGGVNAMLPSDLSAGNWQWTTATIFRNDADGKSITTWTNSAVGGESSLYSYSTPKYTNSVQNAKGAIYYDGSSQNFNLREGNRDLTNFCAWVVASSQAASPNARIMDYGSLFYVQADSTRSNYLSQSILGTVMGTNLVGTNVFLLGIWRSGTEVRLVRETGPFLTNTIAASGVTVVGAHGLGGNTPANTARWTGRIFEAFVNTNATTIEWTNFLRTMNYAITNWNVTNTTITIP